MDEAASTKTEYYTTSTGKKYETVVTINELDKTVSSITNQSTETIYGADFLGRIEQKTQKVGANEVGTEYTYKTLRLLSAVNNYSNPLQYMTTLVESEEFSNNILPGFTYEYDNYGNITEIRENNVLVQKYYYDSDNQLIREDNKYLNNGNGYTVKYTYSHGNITSKTYYPFSPNISNLNNLTPLDSTYCPKTQYSIVFYQTDPKAKEILKAKSCLSDWSGPHAPEDLAFFIDDVCWFFSVGHESIACFPHPDNEDKLFVEENGLFLFDSNEEYYDDFDEKGLAKLIDKKLDK